MKSRFRPTTPDDALAVAAFLQRIFAIDADRPLVASDHLDWKYWQDCPGWVGSRGYVITKDGAITAHGAVVPLSCVIGGERLQLVHLIDWAADPKAVGSGVTLLKNIAAMADAVLIAGGSETTQKVLPALGFKDRGEVTKCALPLRPGRHWAEQKPSLRSAAKFARNLLWSWRAPSVAPNGWSASRAEPEQVAFEAVRWPSFERSAERFRYLVACPVASMELYSVSKEGKQRGYFMLAHVPGQVRIADFFADSEDPYDWRSVVELAVLQAKRDQDAAEVVALGSDELTTQALTDSGFRPRGQSAMRLLCRKGVELSAGTIQFQMIDSDAAYLHDGRVAYWS